MINQDKKYENPIGFIAIPTENTENQGDKKLGINEKNVIESHTELYDIQKDFLSKVKKELGLEFEVIEIKYASPEEFLYYFSSNILKRLNENYDLLVCYRFPYLIPKSPDHCDAYYSLLQLLLQGEIDVLENDTLLTNNEPEKLINFRKTALATMAYGLHYKKNKTKEEMALLLYISEQILGEEKMKKLLESNV